ncbi:hypothetical protein H632_c4539p0 [Helicosporidium sp. ATCC 50920]|nr:hypothetical protein H632_c4539p0 [Helicosporidium sp. ATCC 50920]|eukprot:KDD71698.1 hypothetical protein H632_c4539p0 [Helicosporidium sp. ATCC 50920]
MRAARRRRASAGSDSGDFGGAEPRTVDLVETPEAAQSSERDAAESEVVGGAAESAGGEKRGDATGSEEGDRGGGAIGSEESDQSEDAAENRSAVKALFRMPLAEGSTFAAGGAESASRSLWDDLLERPRQGSRGKSDAFDLLLSPHKRELPKQLLGDLQAALQPSPENFD